MLPRLWSSHDKKLWLNSIRLRRIGGWQPRLGWVRWADQDRLGFGPGFGVGGHRGRPVSETRPTQPMIGVGAKRPIKGGPGVQKACQSTEPPAGFGGERKTRFQWRAKGRVRWRLHGGHFLCGAISRTKTICPNWHFGHSVGSGGGLQMNSIPGLGWAIESGGRAAWINSQSFWRGAVNACWIFTSCSFWAALHNP